MKAALEVLIIGGGIAGLWLLATLRARGYDAYLASEVLGEGQTIASQGIIHGGTKYALTGQMTEATLAIGAMPTLWRDALQGKGEVDLRQAELLASHQLLWTSGNIASRMTGFFASKAMKSRINVLDKHEYPLLFQHDAFKGRLYRLDEPVINIPSVLKALQDAFADYLLPIQAAKSHLVIHQNAYAYQATFLNGEQGLLTAKQLILTAGAGNEILLKGLPCAPFATAWPNMQRRPLQMILVKGDLPPLYAHALGVSDKPRMTITSHRHGQGEMVWYLGGQPAEQGAGKNSAELIQHTAKELQQLLPWLAMQDLTWATWQVDRAEGLQANRTRPDAPVLHTFANLMVAWPTKLAFAPLLAQQVLQHLALPSLSYLPLVKNKPLCIYGQPMISTPIWERCSFTKI